MYENRIASGAVLNPTEEVVRSGRSKDWVKVKNPDSTAMRRLIEE